MSSDDPAPYFGISPDKALEALGRPRGHGRHRRDRRGLPDAAATILRHAGSTSQGQKTLRRFSTWEITKYLIPVAPAHFRRVLRQNPDLPQGLTETEGGAKWFTLDEVLRLRAHFAAGRLEGQRLPALPAQGAARQDRGGGQFQGWRRQDLHRRASGDVGRPRRLQGAGGRSRQPGLDDLDLRRPGRGRMGHRLSGAGAALRRTSARARTRAGSTGAKAPCPSMIPWPRRWRSRRRT